ncbi:MAG TPA: FAD-binding oxidoreductase, partial [Solirubrobacteraceae bacterium]|nr:FAD-binding oxidoreductase [Solirubrobacteraceae bacterium]
LSAAVTGRVMFADDVGWDAAREAFNLLLDQHPVAVALPSNAREVAKVVELARERELRIAPRTTGHNAGPLGSLENTVLLDTSGLAGIDIDVPSARVHVGAGTRWGEVIGPLSDAGLAALHGSSPDVGIVGYSLGGGMGWLARKYGLQANSVTAVELVTAEGRHLRCDELHEPDLFWALRGGGGNFGVVTGIEFDVYPVAQLYAGGMMFGFERAADVLQVWNELLPELPEEMTTWAMLLHLPDLPFVPEPMRGGSFASVLGAFLGDEEEGRELLRPVRNLGPAMDTFAMVAPDALGELAMDPPHPLPYLSAHQLLDGMTPASVEALVATADRTSNISVVQLRHTGGALARPVPGAGARATLPGRITMFALGIPGDEASAAQLRSSLRSVESILAPRQTGRYASFVEEPTDTRLFFDAASWDRLCRVKRLYDPTDLFRANHHVPPSW